jgi:MFS superfamily sulfate permease-like transporter
MNLGTIALCGLLTADIISDIVDDPEVEQQASIEIALCVAFLTGVILFLMALLRLGESVQRYLSPALVGGFHTGAAIHVMVSQFSHLLGVTAPTEIHGEFSIMRKLWYYGNEMVDANGATAVIAISAMLIIYACKKITAGRIVFGRGRCGISIASADEAQRLRFPIPAELIVVIIFNSLTYMASLDTNYGVKVVGEYVPFRSLPARPTCTPRPAKSHSKRDSKSTRTHVHTRTPTHAHARPRTPAPPRTLLCADVNASASTDMSTRTTSLPTLSGKTPAS